MKLQTVSVTISMADSSLNLSSSAPITFAHTISTKLDEMNFLLWRQQIEPVIKAHCLQHFVVCPKIPLRFLNEYDRNEGRINPEYTVWEQQDQMLMSWLQCSLSPAILSRVLGSVHSYQVWDKIHDYFHKQTRARARQLRTKLRSTLLEEKTMEEFLLRIKALVDALASVGESVSQQEHVDVILEGLSQDYSSIISVIESKFDTPSIEEVEALLLAHEMRTQKYKKKLLSESAAVNLTQVPNSNPNFQQNGSVDNQVSHSSQGADVNMNGGRNAYRGRGGRRGRGRSGRYSGIQCQVCCKIGHIAANCYHCFDQNYQPIFTYNFQGNFSQNHENSFSGNVGQQSYVNQPQQFFSHNGSNN